MSHKTKVNGTNYEIDGGKTKVEGTAYEIKGGKTRVGGTAYKIGFVPSFADSSWEEIIAACQNKTVPDEWSVGDQKAMNIGGTDYMIDIIGKNHDTYSDGSGKAPLTFQFYKCYNAEYPMNDALVDYCWRSCEMRNTHLPSIKALMPTAIQNAIKSVNKLTSGMNTDLAIETTADELFLLSEVEVTGTTNYSLAGEGEQYEYYSNGGAIRKRVADSYNSYTGYHLRSPYRDNRRKTVYVYQTGTISYGGAYATYPVAPAFCF